MNKQEEYFDAPLYILILSYTILLLAVGLRLKKLLLCNFTPTQSSKAFQSGEPDNSKPFGLY